MHFLEVSEADERTRESDAHQLMEKLHAQYSSTKWSRVQGRSQYCPVMKHPEVTTDHWEVLAKSDDGRMAIWLWEGPDTGVVKIVEVDEVQDTLRRRNFLRRMRSETKVLLVFALAMFTNHAIAEHRLNRQRREYRKATEQLFRADSERPKVEIGTWQTGTLPPSFTFTPPQPYDGLFLSPEQKAQFLASIKKESPTSDAPIAQNIPNVAASGGEAADRR